MLAAIRAKFFWVNLVTFQAAWFLGVIFNDLAIVPMALLLCLHFYSTPKRRADLAVLLAVLPFGIALDGSLILAGWVDFAGGWAFPGWLILLWGHFCVSLNHGLRWLWSLPRSVIVLFGALGGPMTYWGGTRLGAAVMSEPVLAFTVMAIAWAAIMFYAAWLIPRTSTLASLADNATTEDVKA
jgi:hypothetical protein